MSNKAILQILSSHKFECFKFHHQKITTVFALTLLFRQWHAFNQLLYHKKSNAYKLYIRGSQNLCRWWRSQIYVYPIVQNITWIMIALGNYLNQF